MINRWSNLGHDVIFIKNLPTKYDKLSEKWWEICKLKSMRFFEKHIPEEYKQEIKGMVDGLNAQDVKLYGRKIEYEDIVASQFVQDVQNAFFNYFSYKRIHPIRSLLYGSIEILSKDKNYEEIGHCRAILATGDATSDKGIVVAHATIFPNYIAERCNFIVDIKPLKGYRFIMTGPPGSLWSQEDYYQNEKGIVLTETELIPQGFFNIRKAPKGVRSRNAIQYSASIDEVIENLQNGNNGLIPNEWLIGDIKTGEIARLEQALYHTPITRTKNGIFTSSNYPHDNKVERELWVFTSKLFLKNFPTKDTSRIYKKFNDLEKQYYGKIDIEIVKKILTTFPISENSTDVKITNSKLMNNMGLITYFGRPVGDIWVPSDKYITKFKGVTGLPPSGWVEIFPCQSSPVVLPSIKRTVSEKNKDKILWQFETESLGNVNYSSSIVDEEIVYAATSSGIIYAIKNNTGKKIWSKSIGETSVDPVIYGDLLYVGTNNGVHALDKKTGKTVWKQLFGYVLSKPVIWRDTVIVGFSYTGIHAFDLNSGKEMWSFKFENSAYISEIKNDILYAGSGVSCFGFDIIDKEIIWERNTSGPITSSPKISDRTVFVGSWDGDLYALNADTGELKWKYETGWGIDSTPAVSDGVVFVGSLDNNFYAVNEDTGDLKWFYTCKAAIHSSPFVYGEYVFFGCDDGKLYALNKTEGVLAWSYTPGYSITENNVNNYITSPILSNPFVKEGVVFFGANGSVYAIDAQTFETQKEVSEKKFYAKYDMLLLAGILVIVIVTFILLFVRIKGKNRN